MKKLPLFIILCFFVNNTFAQYLGIKFETLLNWEQIKEKAKNENKYIFLDCFATWCAPCKFMSEKVFPDSSVGAFMNSNFVNVAIQMDRKPTDAELIRRWYNDARSIEVNYSITSYPTYLFFNPDGEVVHRIVGATGGEPSNFIVKAKDALLPDSQYYTRIRRDNQIHKDSASLFIMIKTALNNGDKRTAEELGAFYLKTLKNPLLKEHILLLEEALRSAKGVLFEFFLDNRFKIDSILDLDRYTANKLASLVLDEKLPDIFKRNARIINYKDIANQLAKKFSPLKEEIKDGLKNKLRNQVKIEFGDSLFKENVPVPTWSGLIRHFQQRFPGINVGLIIALDKPAYYRYKGLKAQAIDAAYDCLKGYGNDMSNRELNIMAWNLFQYASEKHQLKEALRWSRKTIDEYPNIRYISTIEYMDTYANLLYKLGEYESGIKWERRTIEKMESLDPRVIDTSLLNEFKLNAAKMKAGESTWP